MQRLQTETQTETQTQTRAMRPVIGFAVGSVSAALIGAAFWPAVLVGIVGAAGALIARNRPIWKK